MIPVNNFNQADMRWADQIIANGLTMRADGCCLTATADALKAWQIEIDPGALLAKAKAEGDIDVEANFIEARISNMFPGIMFYRRAYTTNVQGSTPSPKLLPEEALKRIKRLLAAGQPVIAWVDNLYHDGYADHFVCIKDLQQRNGKTDLLLNNPDGGLEQWFADKYGDPMTTLYGYIALIGDSAYGTPIIVESTAEMAFKLAEIKAGKNVAVYSAETLDNLLES